jgi:fused signal recognition particle receptor
MIVAADTFRAAAIEQLERWAERAAVPMTKQREGADPAAVVFDALRAARARDVQTVIVDTAGRLHTKTNLMAELEKLARVSGREVPGAPHEVLLVVDATTGQNGLTQAKEFTRVAELTGVVLTKLDGTAKGGVALGIHRQLGLPIRYVGVGEAIDDLLEFESEAFLDGLLGDGA